MPIFCKLLNILPVLLLLFILKLTNCSIVTTSYGSIEGTEISGDGNVYHVFKKVPFAQPPVGKLRFQKPETVKKWDGVLNGREYGPACMSNSTVSKSPQKYVDEDCLHLNIFTTQKCLSSKNCPVVFYIHGGGMAYDSAVMFNDTFLLKTFASRDIILVISAFRLGIFSHFIIEDQSIAPTNIGAYDIIEALEFVNSEINNFGGDNKKVTLFGHSYGGAVAAAFTFSTNIDKEQRLFQQVIAMSPGREFLPLDSALNQTKIFAERANCMPPNAQFLSDKSQVEKYMLGCLQNMDQFALLRIQRKMEEDGYPEFQSMIQRLPLFQGNSYSEFVRNPKPLPLVTGCNLHELNDSKRVIPIGEIFDFRNQMEVNEKYQEDQKKGNLEYALSDQTLMFKVDAMVRAEKLRKVGAPVYVYEYNYPKHSEHTDDLSYIMGIHVFDKDENEEHLSIIYPELFMNFVKLGKPADDWDVYNTTARNYYDVNWNEKTGLRPQMRNNMEEEIYNYWFVEMREFDRNVTLAEKLKYCKLKQLLCDFSVFYRKAVFIPTPPTHVDHRKSNSTTTYFIFMVLVLLSGMLIGRCICNRRRNRNQYIQPVHEKSSYGSNQPIEVAIKA